MNTRSEGLHIGHPNVSRKIDVGAAYLTEKERNLGTEILKVIKEGDCSYLGANRVLYTVDRELQFRANNNKL
ncbi:hypothetical protein [Staphylococcus aureus]|uniref:hypothetical protein n=1 Tax=Staphylococcus aureus TaxID=1280 RepID=UPI000DFA71B4|nr:hypothetical protein [Staphylococcus aureus]SUK09175.1 phage protein [Staphylococcus aureus]SUK14464.1 phage protein [Staphylococcus aureus]